MSKRYFHPERWYDTIAVSEGAFWVCYLWCAQWSLVNGQSTPFLPATIVMAAVILAIVSRRSMRLALRRFRVRKRRTEMLMHLMLPPLLLGPLIWWLLERLVGELPGAQRWTLAALLASAGWAVFVISVLIKRLIRHYQEASPTADEETTVEEDPPPPGAA
ncbi:hypothetical protein [Kushneria phosphatilytica]|uniref:Uncharacterized protein n=1 Tax=Kushneria phosphatilytica TaxID=657387 RepID=A0A1S1NT22_9GAMM|nr:hypothetical protein [Kushneria phosphatilytica]OHV08630.1 hypothetical protein BH688_11305 [Kushneria phosphatilytica]QEL12337.1 hypothetical protein FY550_15130 [Kushneria phosphatilytica]